MTKCIEKLAKTISKAAKQWPRMSDQYLQFRCKCPSNRHLPNCIMYRRETSG